jgi:transcriptional regulator with PAS, ATPase and Fis domain
MAKRNHSNRRSALDLSEVQEAMLPAAREFLSRGLTLGRGKQALTVAAISIALEKTGNNQSSAARLLNISQPTISEAVDREEFLARFRNSDTGRFGHKKKPAEQK